MGIVSCPDLMGNYQSVNKKSEVPNSTNKDKVDSDSKSENCYLSKEIVGYERVSEERRLRSATSLY